MTAGDLAVCSRCLRDSWLVFLLTLYIERPCKDFDELDLEREFTQVHCRRPRNGSIYGKDSCLEQKLRRVLEMAYID